MERVMGRIGGRRAGRLATLVVLWPVLLAAAADADPIAPAPVTPATAGPPVLVAAVAADTPPARPAAGERALMLATTVVTATRHESETLKSPVAITVVGPERIERSVNPSVADLLREVPGVFVVDNTIAGMQRLRIRGEDARRGMVLLDGQEISDHSSFGPGLLIDPSFIERIEVVRGPHSTLYGSRAAGGVINVITRKRPEREVEATLASGYSGATDGWRADGMLAVRKGGAWMRASGAGMDNNDRDTPEGPLDDTSNDADSALIQAGWSDDRHDLRMLYDFYDLSSRAATPESLVDGSVISKYRMDMPKRDRDRVAAFYDGKNLLPGLERVHLDAYWQQVDRRLTQDIAGLVMPPTPPPTRYDYANDDRDTIDTWGINAQADWKPHRDHLLTTGLSWIDDTLDKVVDRTGTLTRGPLVTPVDESLQTDAGIWTTALFAQDTWTFLEDWQLTAGVRWYHVHSVLDDSNDPLLVTGSEDDDAAVGSASLVWNPLEPLALRASWGQGYVYPTLLQLHTGSLFGQGNITRPNPNLDPETSNNWELGARWQDRRYALDTAVFYTLSDDYIAAVSAADAPESGWPAYERTYTNLDSAETWGVEAAGSALLGNTGAEAYGVLTYLHRELEFATFKTSKSGLPELSGRVGLRYEHELPFGSNGYVDLWVAAGGESEEKTSRSTTSTGSWATVNVSMGIEHEHGWLGIELLNIADESYRPTTQELVQPGCHMNVGARIEF